MHVSDVSHFGSVTWKKTNLLNPNPLIEPMYLSNVRKYSRKPNTDAWKRSVIACFCGSMFTVGFLRFSANPLHHCKQFFVQLSEISGNEICFVLPNKVVNCKN